MAEIEKLQSLILCALQVLLKLRFKLHTTKVWHAIIHGTKRLATKSVPFQNLSKNKFISYLVKCVITKQDMKLYMITYEKGNDGTHQDNINLDGLLIRNINICMHRLEKETCTQERSLGSRR